jgi:hypothetical protein
MLSVRKHDIPFVKTHPAKQANGQQNKTPCASGGITVLSVATCALPSAQPAQASLLIMVRVTNHSATNRPLRAPVTNLCATHVQRDMQAFIRMAGYGDIRVRPLESHAIMCSRELL